MTGLSLNKMGRDRALRALRMGLGLGAAVFLVGPAHAEEIGAIASSISGQVCTVFSVAYKVLIVASVLAVLIGLAPMLWGQVKVKWVVSSLVATTLMSAIPPLVAAFAGVAAPSGCATT